MPAVEWCGWWWCERNGERPPLQLQPTAAAAARSPRTAVEEREKEREKGGEEEEREKMACGAHMLVGPTIVYVNDKWVPRITF
jgi:hypothetical protein